MLCCTSSSLLWFNSGDLKRSPPTTAKISVSSLGDTFLPLHRRYQHTAGPRGLHIITLYSFHSCKVGHVRKCSSVKKTQFSLSVDCIKSFLKVRRDDGGTEEPVDSIWSGSFMGVDCIVNKESRCNYGSSCFHPVSQHNQVALCSGASWICSTEQQVTNFLCLILWSLPEVVA